MNQDKGDEVPDANSHPDALLERYLDALGVQPSHPSVEDLFRLHRAHVLRFPHDTVWAVRRRVPPLRDEAVVRALVDGEGGACLHLTGGFAWLLTRLGYAVCRHRARYQGAFGRSPDSSWEAHMVLTVQVDGQRWYVDPGLGNGILDPLPLRAGDYAQDPFRYQLRPSSEVPGGWQFIHDPKVMGVRVVEFRPEDSPLSAWAEAHLTDAALGATGPLAVNHRQSAAAVSLVGRRLLTVTAAGRRIRRLADRDEWEQD